MQISDSDSFLPDFDMSAIINGLRAEPIRNQRCASPTKDATQGRTYSNLIDDSSTGDTKAHDTTTDDLLEVLLEDAFPDRK